MRESHHAGSSSVRKHCISCIQNWRIFSIDTFSFLGQALEKALHRCGNLCRNMYLALGIGFVGVCRQERDERLQEGRIYAPWNGERYLVEAGVSPFAIDGVKLTSGVELLYESSKDRLSPSLPKRCQ